MKITVITGKKGEIEGAFHGHAKEIRSKAGLYAVPVSGPGQRFHEVEVPDEIFPDDATPEMLAKLPEELKRFLQA